MNWGAPNWLWSLLALPPLALALHRTLSSRKRRFERFAKPAVWRRIAPELDFGARVRKGWVLLIALAFILLAAARPRWGTVEESVKLSGMDIVVAFDVSNSMLVEDIAPSRLRKGRHVVQNLVDQLSGDRVGIVAFAASSFLACPLTNDLEYVKETLQTLDPRIILNQGTDLGTALETASRALDRGSEIPASDKQDEADPDPTSSKAIVLVSDGEDHEEKAIEAAKKAKAAGIRLYVLGVGTSKGGPIATRDENGNLRGFKRDRRGEAVISRFDPSALQEMARAADGRYWSVSDAETEVNELVKDLVGLDRKDSGATRKYVTHQERFQYPLFIGILLLLIELGIPARRLLGIAFLSCAAAASLAPREARAEGIRSYLENRKGLKAFEQGKIPEAQKSFGNAQALEPDSPAIQYNQGVVELKAGDADRAIEDFTASAQAAKASDPALAGRSYFNLGAALQGKGDIPGARQGYLEALRSAKKARDGELEEKARKSLELLARQEERQKQQQEKDRQKQDQNQENQEKQEGEGEQKEQKDGEGQDQKDDPAKDPKEGGKDAEKKEQEPKQYQDPSKQGRRQFRSEKLSKEDAERVMSELSGRERELQQKLRRQKGESQANEKDW